MLKIKEILTLILIILLILTLSGCDQADLEKYAEEIQKDPSFCETMDGEEKNICYVFAATRREEPDLCYKITSSKIRLKCLSELAHEIIDPKQCEELNDPHGSFSLRTACYTNVAIFTKNESFCYNVGPKNKNECKLFENEDIANECIFMISYKKNSCLKQMAGIKQDISICNNKLIASPYDHKSFCYDSVAISQENSSLCEHISCIKIIAINKGDIELCEQIDNSKLSTDREQEALFYYPPNHPKPTRSEEKDQCFSRIAHQFNNAETCLNIQDKSVLKHCLTHFLSQLKNKDICFKISDNKLKNSCFVEVAKNTNNIKICENIREESFDEDCWMDEKGWTHCSNEGYSSLIPLLKDTHKPYLNKFERYKVIECYLPLVKKDHNKFKEITNDSIKLRNACYYTLSLEINNPELCSNILIPEINNVTCEDYLQTYNLESHHNITPAETE